MTSNKKMGNCRVIKGYKMLEYTEEQEKYKDSSDSYSY